MFVIEAQAKINACAFFVSTNYAATPVMYQSIRANFICVLYTLLVLLIPVKAVAQPEMERALTVSGAALNFGYQEFNDNGKQLNQEHGIIPGLTMRFSQAQGRWLIVGDLSYYSGDVTYNGLTNIGTPVTTRTGQKIAELSMHAEYWRATAGGFNYALYSGAGYYYRERDIQPTRTATGAPVSGLFETYQWWLGFLGAKTVLYTSERAQWILDTRFTRPVNPSVTADFNGVNDGVRLGLGGRWGTRWALPWYYTANQAMGFVVEPFVESYELGRSATMPLTRNGVIIGTVSEPRSESFNYGFMISVQRRF